MKVCPKSPNHKEFVTSVVEYHDWKVDGDGHFIADLGCHDSEKPRSDNGWECAICGAEAVDE